MTASPAAKPARTKRASDSIRNVSASYIWTTWYPSAKLPWPDGPSSVSALTGPRFIDPPPAYQSDGRGYTMRRQGDIVSGDGDRSCSPPTARERDLARPAVRACGGNRPYEVARLSCRRSRWSAPSSTQPVPNRQLRRTGSMPPEHDRRRGGSWTVNGSRREKRRPARPSSLRCRTLASPADRGVAGLRIAGVLLASGARARRSRSSRRSPRP